MPNLIAFRRWTGLVLASGLLISLTAVPHSDAAAPPARSDEVVSVDASRTGCLVPFLRGYRLPAVRTALEWANCSLGRVTYRRTEATKRGKVVAQSRVAGRRLPAGHPVGVTLGSR